jgi:hypothetical protein
MRECGVAEARPHPGSWTWSPSWSPCSSPSPTCPPGSLRCPACPPASISPGTASFTIHSLLWLCGQSYDPDQHHINLDYRYFLWIRIVSQIVRCWRFGCLWKAWTFSTACCKAGPSSILGSAPQGGFSYWAYKRWGDGERPRRMATDKCIGWMWLNECMYVRL